MVDGPTETKSMVFCVFFCHVALFGQFFHLSGFLPVDYDTWFCGRFVCVCVCVSLPLYFFFSWVVGFICLPFRERERESERKRGVRRLLSWKVWRF